MGFFAILLLAAAMPVGNAAKRAGVIATGKMMELNCERAMGTLAAAICPNTHPYAYMAGKRCCSQAKKTVILVTPECDGTIISFGTHAKECCEDSIECPYEKCKDVAIDGGWSDYGPCDSNCDSGIKARTCTEPVPYLNIGGKDCPGSATESCNTEACTTSSFETEGYWGDWGNLEMCPTGTYAVGFNVKHQEYCGSVCEDTLTNAVELTCSDGVATKITSAVGGFGQWHPTGFECSGGYSGVKVYFESSTGDIGATVCVEFYCKSSGTWQVPEIPAYCDPRWDTTGGPTEHHCAGEATGEVICGLRTQVEPDLGPIDHSALNSVEFHCCQIP